MNFLKNKIVWVVGALVGLFMFQRLDYGQRKWVYAAGIVGAWIAWGMKKIGSKLALVISVVLVVAYALNHFIKLSQNADAVASGRRTSLDDQ